MPEQLTLEQFINNKTALNGDLPRHLLMFILGGKLNIAITGKQGTGKKSLAQALKNHFRFDTNILDFFENRQDLIEQVMKHKDSFNSVIFTGDIEDPDDLIRGLRNGIMEGNSYLDVMQATNEAVEFTHVVVEMVRTKTDDIKIGGIYEVSPLEGVEGEPYTVKPLILYNEEANLYQTISRLSPKLEWILLQNLQKDAHNYNNFVVFNW